MAITYRGKELVDVPKNKAYIPILQYNASIDNESKDIIYGIQSKAITPDFADTDNTFGNFIYDKNKFSYLIDFIKKKILLSFDKYKMSDLYPNIYKTMTEIQNRDDKIWDTSKLTNMHDMFGQCESITSLDLSNFDTSKVTNMSNMFFDCKAITSLNLSNFDTSNANYMIQMFCSCESITSLDLSNFDTSKVTDMGQMFGQCKSITSLDLSNFDTSNVTHMGWMFQSCESITSLDLSNFDTSKVTNMMDMFNNCKNLTTIKGVIDMKSCTVYYRMFENCPKLTGVKIKNPPADFEAKTGITASQYTVVQ